MKTINIATILVVILVIILIITNVIMYNHKKLDRTLSNIRMIDYYTHTFKNLEKRDVKKLINMPIYVINLERSKSRYDYMKKQEKEYVLKFTFIKAIDGKKLKHLSNGVINFYNELPINYKTNFRNNNTLYELACTLSHIKAIKTVYENKDKYALICEDDINFCLTPTWNENELDIIINNAPKDWGVISLYRGCNVKSSSDYIEYVENECFGMCSYIIRYEACEIILEKLVKNNLTVYLDKKISRRDSVGSDNMLPLIVKHYSYKKSILLPLNNTNLLESTIHSNHTDTHVLISLDIMKHCYKNLKPNFNIPKRLHLIWLGPKEQPKTLLSWTVDFVKKYPGWEVKVWNDKDIDGLKLENKKQYDDTTDYRVKLDIARCEIMYRFGGMYVDTGSVWLKNPIHKDMLKGMLNISKEDNKLIMNGWFSSIPNHPFFRFVMDNMKNLKTEINVMTEVYNEISNNIKVLKFDINIVDLTIILSNKYKTNKEAFLCMLAKK